MKIKRIVILLGIVCLFALMVRPARAGQGDTTWQILADIDNILDKNPMPPGKDAQLIKIAEDDTLSMFVVRMLPGAELGPHFHQGHDEIEYVVRGQAELFIDGRWAAFKAGNIHFNPTGKIHAARNRSDEPLVVLIAFTPGMRKTDRHFVKQPDVGSGAPK